MGERPATERTALRRVQSLLGVRVTEDVPARRNVGLDLQRLPAHIAVGHLECAVEAPENGDKFWLALLFWRPREFCFGPAVAYLAQVLRSRSACALVQAACKQHTHTLSKSRGSS